MIETKSIAVRFEESACLMGEAVAMIERGDHRRGTARFDMARAVLEHASESLRLKPYRTIAALALHPRLFIRMCMAFASIQRSIARGLALGRPSGRAAVAQAQGAALQRLGRAS